MRSSSATIMFVNLYWALYGAPELGRRWLLCQVPIQQALLKLTADCDALTLEQLRPPIDGEPPPVGTHG